MEKTTNTEFWGNFEIAKANGEVEAAQACKNVYGSVKNVLKTMGFDPSDYGTKKLAKIITKIYFARKAIDGESLTTDVKYIGELYPEFDFDNVNSEIIRHLSLNGYAFEAINNAKTNSLLNDRSLNEIIYPIVSEFSHNPESIIEVQKTR